jgi:hypothetical protein
MSTRHANLSGIIHEVKFVAAVNNFQLGFNIKIFTSFEGMSKCQA